MNTTFQIIALIILTIYIVVCSQVIIDHPAKTIWPWTVQPTPINMQKLDDMIGRAEPGSTIIIQKEGSFAWGIDGELWTNITGMVADEVE